jgi:ATP-binding cassette, subfamily F, member 3
MLQFINVYLNRDKKVLFQKASFSIRQKQKIGLVGANGCGKSSLFSLILNQLHQDDGEILSNAQLTISHLAQTIPDSNMSALDYVLEGDTEYTKLINKLKNAQLNNDNDAIFLCHEALNTIQGYAIPAKAASILSGLGFKTCQQNMRVNQFSGGWRMRLNLARCLLNPAQLLLLDEPTNHLDLDAIIWLEKWLKSLSATVILISHDRDFLDAITSHILHIELHKVIQYTGNYSQFEHHRAQKLALQQKSHEKQQRQIKHMMQFVEKFKAKATKAKQAQSRLKAIAKLDIITQAHIDSPFNFKFKKNEYTPNPILKLEHVTLGYGATPILSDVNLLLSPGNRIGLLGPNGCGKSTLIKALAGILPPLSGDFHKAHKNLTIAYYAQHQLEQLDLQQSPVTHIQRLSPHTREQEIRSFLGSFNFIGDMATAAIATFSGGEKARLVLALLVWQKPNLLLLDEPTNHLDIEMRTALELSLQTYEGAMVIISHDRHLLRATVDEFYLVADKCLKPFCGDLEDYSDWLQNQNQSSVKKDKKNRYQEKKMLNNKIKKVEQEIELTQKRLIEIENLLGDNETYDDKSIIEKLIDEQKELKTHLDKSEQAWLDAMNQLDE